MNIRTKTRNSKLETRNSLGAFTLVELLMVIVIIGILAAVVLPKFTGRGEQARLAAAQAQIGSFKTALNAFEVDNGYFPKGQGGLQDLLVQPRDATGWHGPYLEQGIPKDPWGHDYVYVCPGRRNSSSYDVYSIGPDGRDGTEDDIGNWQAGK